MPAKHRIHPVTSLEHDVKVGATLRGIVESSPQGHLHFHTIDDDGLNTITIDTVIDGRIRSITKTTLLAALQELAGTSPTKKCTFCRQEKGVEYFALSRYQRDGRAARCKLCEAQRQREYSAAKRAANPKPMKPRRQLSRLGQSSTSARR
jgi:hypothetical protein